MNSAALRNIGIILLLALAVFALPGGGTGAAIVAALIGIAFSVAIWFFLMRMYREHRMTIFALGDRYRAIFYGSARGDPVRGRRGGRWWDSGALTVAVARARRRPRSTGSWRRTATGASTSERPSRRRWSSGRRRSGRCARGGLDVERADLAVDDADRLDRDQRRAALALDDRRVDELERAPFGVDVVDVQVGAEHDGG